MASARNPPLNGDASIDASMPEAGELRIWQDPGPVSPEVTSLLADLHPGLRELASLRVLLLHGNPLLGLPGELLGRDNRGCEWDGSVPEILDYYFRTRGGARPLNEAKLILLGWVRSSVRPRL